MITWKGRQWAPVAVDRSRVLLVRGTFDGTTLSGLVHEYAPRRELDGAELQAAQAWLNGDVVGLREAIERLPHG